MSISARKAKGTRIRDSRGDRVFTVVNYISLTLFGLAALYPLMADAQDDPLPTLTVFETEMAELGISLLAYSVSSGTVSFDGQTATLVLDAEIRSRDGGDAQIVRESVPLRRVQDNWTMDIGTLRSLMIRD